MTFVRSTSNCWRSVKSSSVVLVSVKSCSSVCCESIAGRESCRVENCSSVCCEMIDGLVVEFVMGGDVSWALCGDSSCS